MSKIDTDKPVSVTVPRRKARLLSTVSALALVATGLVGSTALLKGTPALAGSPPPVTADRISGQMSIADLVEKVKPAVVAVKVDVKQTADTRDGEGAPSGMPDFPKGSPMERFFKQFGDQFGQQQIRPRGPQQHAQAQGSGFIISPDGYIVTNNHVVDNAVKVQVTLDDGRTLDAKVIGKDAKTDVALLKAEGGGVLPFVTFAKDTPRVGENVVAIGNPFGLGGTVTSGIVSARGRDIGAGPYDDFLQIDAAVNRGNSGGPAFNLKGEVVGVNTAIYSPSGGSVGIGFAIPAETVQNVVAQIKEHGTVARGYLGIRMQSVTQDVADGLGLKDAKGVLVDTAEAGTPAAKAGLKSGDVITAVNGMAITDGRDLARKIGALKPGAKIELSYLRDGRTATTTIALAAVPDSKTAKAKITDDGQDKLAALGLMLAPAKDVQGAGKDGVAVVEINPNGVAAQKGMREGDVILEVGGKAVAQAADVRSGIDAAKAEGRKAVLMKLKSADGTRFVAVPVAPKA